MHSHSTRFHPTSWWFRILKDLALGALMGCSVAAFAQATPLALAVGSTLQLAATDAKGQPFSMAQAQGKVAVVFIWTTSCAVCRDSLPELRSNLRGWANKPFVLVSANIDRKTEDWLVYDAAMGLTQNMGSNWVSVHQRADLPPTARLPVTLLVNPQGKVIARYEGRLAPEVWDSVAELLP
ncbi:MAG: hypothetical protein RL032_586 [Pseudomonadota bacterium]|jgi:cytochrome oxidase Cu insertion factor (SCO1/SenC/PrrC family)